jgi:hypothetical protein
MQQKATKFFTFRTFTAASLEDGAGPRSPLPVKPHPCDKKRQNSTLFTSLKAIRNWALKKYFAKQSQKAYENTQAATRDGRTKSTSGTRRGARRP